MAMHACQAYAILDSPCTLPFDVVVASPLFIDIALSLLGRAAATEPSCLPAVGVLGSRLAALLLFRAAERPQLTSNVCCGVGLPRSTLGTIEEASPS